MDIVLLSLMKRYNFQFIFLFFLFFFIFSIFILGKEVDLVLKCEGWVNNSCWKGEIVIFFSCWFSF